MAEYKSFLSMSPFEIRNELKTIAGNYYKTVKNKKKKATILNAGRGNPNFLNTIARDGFSYLNLFATSLAKEKSTLSHLGFGISSQDIYKKLLQFLKKHKAPGSDFLKKCIEFAITNFKLNSDAFVFELTKAILGDYYPNPSRIFPLAEKILKQYLLEILSTDNHTLADNNFDLFATEGATAAMIYIFNSLKINKIIKERDKIAIITPIFPPYLEIPLLEEFDLTEVLIEQKSDFKWHIPQKELNKLKDKKVKALFLVNPSNPVGVAICDNTFKALHQIIKKHNPNLIIISDTVYATFLNKFHCITKYAPHNTINVYSFSKYFGVTGWRLGLIMLHPNNVIDNQIKNLSEKSLKPLDARYKIVSPHPRDIKFIDRLEIDSRLSALAHTGGISTPQQAMMVILALYAMTDKNKKYHRTICNILSQRMNNLFKGLNIKQSHDYHLTNYYALINIEHLALKKHGKKFHKQLIEKHHPLEFLIKLAQDHGIICLPAEGFAAPKWCIRISLANLHDDAYLEIGLGIKETLKSLFNAWKS